MTINLSPIAASIAWGFLDKKSSYEREILNPELIWNSESRSMNTAIRNELRNCESFTMSAAFITVGGLAMLKQDLLNFKGQGQIITSRYLDFNEPEVFEELLQLPNIQVRIFEQNEVGFHAKGYVFRHKDSVTAIVGSSNLTANALKTNHEWNFKFSAAPDGHVVTDLERAINLQFSQSLPLTRDWINKYEATRSKPHIIRNSNADNSIFVNGKIQPNEMQKEALERIRNLRESGEKRGIVISATGTGKTILAALAMKDAKPKRALFMVHREQILVKAISEFQRVLEYPLSEFGLLTGNKKEVDRPYLFATVQSMNSDLTLQSFAPDYFDLIIIDEGHHSGAKSYQKIIDYFQPKFLLGLTATPERTDDFNIFELFDFNVPYEIRLQTALESKMLTPFHYFGVTDYLDKNEETITDTATLKKLVAPERVKYIVQMLERYGYSRDVKGLMFCSSVKEAEELSALFNRERVNGRLLRTKALSGANNQNERENAAHMLEKGQLDYLLTVDIFNEGIDIPAVNQIVMLRNTQSAIIFTQQLGRGLRKVLGKDHLRVIDFIGNYTNNYLIPIALYGDNSRNTDSIRGRVTRNVTDNTLAGISSVNFDEISQKRILRSIQSATLDRLVQLKSEIQKLKDRLNRVPKLYDFLEQGTTDPILMAKSQKNYWRMLQKTKFVQTEPNAKQELFLNFLSNEILPGKRPHELLLIEQLIAKKQISRYEYEKFLEVRGVDFTEETIASVERVLTLSFYSAQQEKLFGTSPIIEVSDNGYSFDGNFSREFADSEFRAHVRDIVKTGLFIARHVESWSAEMKIGNLYSRREVCKMLNFQKNEESTLYGYKVDKLSKTCPIFITYEKEDNISESTKYHDSFIDTSTMHWFTRSRRTLESDEVKRLLSGEYEIHVFVKKNDATGTDFSISVRLALAGKCKVKCLVKIIKY
ncbi:DEAD/DEAH box helicase [Arcanobacterium hippocoleae]